MKKALLSVLIGAAAFSASANQYTLVFDGDNDINGLVRQTNPKMSEWELVKEFSFKENGIDFSIKSTTETEGGFALVNIGYPKSGLVCYASLAKATWLNPQITLTVPGGNITAVKLVMSGDAMSSLDVSFNGYVPEAMSEGAAWSYTWDANAEVDEPTTTAEGDVETMLIAFTNSWYQRYIHYIEVTYTEDLGGKQESGLSFNEQTFDMIVGKDNAMPVLSNPNNLPITWSSSDESVATVNEKGEIIPTDGGKKYGKTYIMASTVGNDKFAAGNTRYELFVIPTAKNAKELFESAPNNYDRVYVDFPATVYFGTMSYAYIEDAERNAACFRNTKNDGSTSQNVITIYKVGDVIPAGWIAKNDYKSETSTWEGLPPAVEEQVAVNYQYVDKVTKEDVNKIVILREVTFTSRTASGNNKVWGTTPNGESYEFQDTFDKDSVGPGTYNVLCAVKYAKTSTTTYFWLAPIEYQDPSAVMEIEENAVNARYFNLQGVEVANPENGVFVKVLNGKATKVVLK